jgi:hypothetical protein
MTQLDNLNNKIKIMNIEDGNFLLTEELKKLILEWSEIKEDKRKCIMSQSYEKAAAIRDMEKTKINKILDLLKEQTDFDFSSSRQIQNDLFLVFDKVEPGDVDFSSAVKRLGVEDLERMRLAKIIMLYNNGKLSLDGLHRSIAHSFRVIKDDLKNKMTKL